MVDKSASVAEKSSSGGSELTSKTTYDAASHGSGRGLRLWEVVLGTVLLSGLLLLPFYAIAVVLRGPFATPSEVVKVLPLGGCGTLEQMFGVVSVVAALVVALAVLSWGRRMKPSNCRYWRAWVDDVLDDARRAKTADNLMLFLGAVCGAAVIVAGLSFIRVRVDTSQITLFVFMILLFVVVSALQMVSPRFDSAELEGYVKVLRSVARLASHLYSGMPEGIEVTARDGRVLDVRLAPNDDDEGDRGSGTSGEDNGGKRGKSAPDNLSARGRLRGGCLSRCEGVKSFFGVSSRFQYWIGAMCASLVFPAIGVSCAVDCASGFRFVGLIALIVLEPVILCVFALLFAVPVVDMLVAAQKDGASTIGAKVLAIYLAVAVWSLAGFLLALVYFISGSDSGVPEFSIPLCALLPAVVWQAPIYRAVNLDRIGAWTGRYRWALVRELERSASRLASFGTGRVDDADLAAVVKVEIDSYKVVSEKAVKAEGGRKDSQGQLDRREISLRRLVENAVGGRYRLPRVESGSETSRARVIRGSVQAGPFRIPLEMEIS